MRKIWFLQAFKWKGTVTGTNEICPQIEDSIYDSICGKILFKEYKLRGYSCNTAFPRRTACYCSKLGEWEQKWKLTCLQRLPNWLKSSPWRNTVHTVPKAIKRQNFNQDSNYNSISYFLFGWEPMYLPNFHPNLKSDIGKYPLYTVVYC